MFIFGEGLAGDGREQLHFLLEMGFLVLSTCGAAVCTRPEDPQNGGLGW